MAWLLVLGYTKNNLFLSVPEESASFFIAFLLLFLRGAFWKGS